MARLGLTGLTLDTTLISRRLSLQHKRQARGAKTHLYLANLLLGRLGFRSEDIKSNAPARLHCSLHGQLNFASLESDDWVGRRMIAKSVELFCNITNNGIQR